MPKRNFTKGARKLVGFRLPDQLKKEIEKLADETGWTVTDVAQTALDQYIQNENEKKKSKKKGES